MIRYSAMFRKHRRFEIGSVPADLFRHTSLYLHSTSTRSAWMCGHVADVWDGKLRVFAYEAVGAHVRSASVGAGRAPRPTISYATRYHIESLGSRLRGVVEYNRLTSMVIWFTIDVWWISKISIGEKTTP